MTARPIASCFSATPGPEVPVKPTCPAKLAPIAAQKILQVIRDINRTGVTVLLVEQNARSALALARRAYVMESGEITLSGEARALLADPRVREAYLGEVTG